MKFIKGDRVNKLTGYEFVSEVRSVFTNKNDQVRLVCESLLIPGMLHIFSPNQMYLMRPGETERPSEVELAKRMLEIG